MMADRKVIDLEDIAGGDALADELERHPEGVVLRRRGIPFASVIPRTNPDPSEDPGASDVSTGAVPGWRARLNGLTPADRLDAIPVLGVDGDPVTPRPMTPDRLERILALVESMEGLIDAEAMHRVVDEGRLASIRFQTEELERERAGAEGAHNGVADTWKRTIDEAVER